MNRNQSTLQAAIVTGLNVLNDPDVRIPAAQAEGVVALRTLLTAIASGQLNVVDATAPAQPVSTLAGSPSGEAPKKVRAPRRAKAQVNGAAVPDATAAPTTVQ